MTSKSPLGKTTDYPQHYSPEQLFGIARAENRILLGLDSALPFRGVDIWNAWELTWLDDQGLPQVACVEIRIPADSPNIVESKSLKLYLGSFAMSHFAAEDDVAKAIRNDIGACVGTSIEIRLTRPDKLAGSNIESLDGDCLDVQQTSCDTWHVDAGLLRLDARSDKSSEDTSDNNSSTQTGSDAYITEAVHSHLLRSMCPVTGQPDCGSVLIAYKGPRIDRDGLLRYIVSYRQHADFHENCVERMFMDILQRCEPEQLSVYARYQRRGGIDINPFRSNTDSTPANTRLWQQ
jgi:7-cyano-7-deazaguanine reductase